MLLLKLCNVSNNFSSVETSHRYFKSYFKGTVTQIEKAVINDQLRVSKVS